MLPNLSQYPLLAPRYLSLAGAAVCAFSMLFAVLYLQQALGMEACPLCIFQRVAFVAAGVIFLLAGLHNPKGLGLKVYAFFALLSSLAGLLVAGRHVWLQYLPADQVPACGPGLNYMLDVFPMNDVLDMVLNGSGECAEVSWRLLGLSIPEWAVLLFVGLAGLSLLQLFRRQ